MTTPITSLQKEYIRLLDNSAAAMTIAHADVAPGAFVGVVWQNLRFAACDFSGQDSIRLASMSNCTFVDCRFLGPKHDFGVMRQVSFRQCRSIGRSIFGGRDGSSGVLFDGCDFSGGDSPPAAFEGIGCTGEVVFRNCTGRGDVLVAGTRLTIDNCQFDNMTFVIGRQRRRGTPLAAHVHIDNSQGTGVWRMVESRMKTGRIRNSSIEQIVNDGFEHET
jgi:uncharacterized protein YjbI with pentapeptide repeats